MVRMGLEAVQAVVFDEEEGAALRERFHLAQAAAIQDPWLERRKPVVANQFSELDTEAPVYGLAPMVGDAPAAAQHAEPAMAAASGGLAITYSEPATDPTTEGADR